MTPIKLIKRAGELASAAKPWALEAVGFGGAAAVVRGVALLNVPSAWILGGVMAIAFAVVMLATKARA